MYYGTVHADNMVLDEACIVFFKKPHTYTCEDLVEFYLHGNYMIAHKVMQLLIKHGARVAERGEFTQRAFLHGRIDLAKAEAVNELISAKTEFGLKVALDKMQGRLSCAMGELKKKIVTLLAEIEAFVDFPDEDIEVFSRKELAVALEDTCARVGRLRESYEHGSILRDGIRTVIVGKPNVGKSSLLNMLIKRDRALVSNVPGTTRDALEELLDINGIIFRIIDTPGMRKGRDALEVMSIERSRIHVAEGQLFIFMLDASRGLAKEDKEIYEQIKGRPFIIVLNKCDLPSKVTAEGLKKWACVSDIISTSTRTRAGMQRLEKKLVAFVWQGALDEDDLVITSERQFEVLIKMEKSLAHAVKSFRERLSLEFLAFDLREALDLLGEFVGEVYGDEILDVVFSKFCIGK
jgi:tRNA modification GTPase